MKNIDSILSDLIKISETPFVNDGSGVGISLSTNNFKYLWFLNNEPNHFSNYSVEVKSPEVAYEIISKFSGKNLEDVKKGISENNSFDSSKPLFLHFIKSIKHI